MEYESIEAHVCPFICPYTTFLLLKLGLMVRVIKSLFVFDELKNVGSEPGIHSRQSCAFGLGFLKTSLSSFFLPWMNQHWSISGDARSHLTHQLQLQGDFNLHMLQRKLWNFFRGKFDDKLINRNANRWWHPLLPDLSLVDFFHGEQMRAKLYYNKTVRNKYVE